MSLFLVVDGLVELSVVCVLGCTPPGWVDRLPRTDLRFRDSLGAAYFRDPMVGFGWLRGVRWR